IGNRLTRAALMLVPVVWPADRDAQPTTEAGDPLDMIERLRAVHAEPVDHVELIKVVYPRTQRGRKRMPIAEVDADDRLGPRLDVCIRVKGPHQRINWERKHFGDAQLRNAVNTGVTLMREVAVLHLCAALGADVACMMRLDARVAAIRRIFVQEPVG